MNVCRLLALLTLLSSSAFANSILTLNLPLVNGVPTLTGTPGQVVNVEATITTDTPLILFSVNANETTSEGDDISIDPTVYLFDSNFGDTIPVGDTTGALLAITFADIAPSVAEVIDLNVQYQLIGDQTIHVFTVSTPAFEVDTVDEIAPEPSTMALAGLGLVGAWFLRRRLRGIAPSPD